MFDMSFLPSQNGGIDYQRFNADSFTSAGDFLDWRRPRGARYVYFLIGHAGNSGSSGFTAASGTSGSGGAGSIGGLTRMIVPAFILPARLFVTVAKGAPAPTAAGAAGTMPTFATGLFVKSGSGIANYLFISSGGAAASAPTSAAGGAGAISGNIATAFIATPNIIATGGGNAGNITGLGANGLYGANTCGSGAAGAGCAATYAPANGGSAGVTSVLDGRQHTNSPGVGSATGGTDGGDGATIWYNDGLMFQSYGGAGGGNASTGKAGNGGKGGLCSGGGGGGAASGAGGSGGFGGAGGDGVIIIAAW